MADENTGKIVDVIIVGAGPAGATTAYYLVRPKSLTNQKSKTGKNLSVTLLEKATFPRDKYCGDAWCAPALNILEEMGILQQLESEGLIQDCTSGGFVSPAGESYIAGGDAAEEVNADTRTYAIKRIICDERIARKAAEVGAQLFEEANVVEASLHNDIWTVRCADGREFKSRLLVASDGATSQLARQLGVVKTPPEGVASRQYVKGGTHNFKSGGVLLFPEYTLPGYVALFRHYNDDIDLGMYIIPGGAAKPEEITDIYEKEIRHDPFLMRVLGPNVQYKERVKIASLRLGGEEKTYASRFLVVGDAAGQTDPLTGEGIHTAMIAGQIAAQRIHEMFVSNDFSEQACELYQQRWMADFGTDFSASANGAKLVNKFPFFMDAANIYAQKVGDKFMDEFAMIMTGVKPKSAFLQPKIAVPMTIESTKLFLKNTLLKQATGMEAYRVKGVETSRRLTSFEATCLIDPAITVAEIDAAWHKNELLEQADNPFKYAGTSNIVKCVLIVYASEYGCTKELAFTLAEQLSHMTIDARSLSPRCVSVKFYSCIDWDKTDVAIFLCATAGDGEPPSEALEFFSMLDRKQLSLSNTSFALLAAGDSSYPKFCQAGKKLEKLLIGVEAKPFVSRVDIDNENAHHIRSWIDAVKTAMANISIVDSDADDYLLESLAQHPEYLNNVDNTCVVTVIDKQQITVTDDKSDRETWHIVLGINSDEEFVWQPGDALGVMPTNNEVEVDLLLNQLPFIGTELVQLKQGKLELPLREALINELDIRQIPSDLFSLLFSKLTLSEKKQFLKRVNVAEGIDEVESHINYSQTRSIIDLLEDISLAKDLDLQKFVNFLKPIKPRYYSISSSVLQSANEITLTVAAVRYETNGKQLTGLASAYLIDRLDIGDSCEVFLQRNATFRRPELDKPIGIVMIGAGTGVAPYRAFLQDISAGLKSQDKTMAEFYNGEFKPMLFFGCRHEAKDFLYKTEWLDCEKADEIKLFPAFSRDTDQKHYIQHRIIEQGDEIWQRINRGDHFYVCGDASQMAGDVENAMLSVMQKHGGLGQGESVALLEELRASGKYNKDVWL